MATGSVAYHTIAIVLQADRLVGTHHLESGFQLAENLAQLGLEEGDSLKQTHEVATVNDLKQRRTRHQGNKQASNRQEEYHKLGLCLKKPLDVAILQL